MAVSTDIKTPLTLVKDQALSIVDSKTEISCFNDSKLTIAHYRTIPNADNNEGRIKWANQASVVLPDGDYAISVSMFEYVVGNSFLLDVIKTFQETGQPVELPDRGSMVIAKDTVTIENGDHFLFRKIVWVKASDLVLGSVAQQKAVADAEAEKQKKYIESLTTGKNPTLGNTDGASKVSSTIWIIISVLLLLIVGIWALIAGKKKRDKAEAEKKASGSVNIIRIPKNT